MASTTFIDRVTPIMASWLNDVDANIYNYRINVKNYGAVGDGITDDTAAIQAAVTFAAGSLGQKIYIPAGTYKVSGNLLGTYAWPRGGGGLHIEGDGSNSTFLVWAGATDGTMIRGFGDGSQTSTGWTYGFTLRGMTLYGNASPFVLGNVSPNTVGIFVEKAQNLWSVEDIMMAGWGTCVQVGVHAERGSFTNCWFGYSYCAVDCFGHYSDLTKFENIYTYAIVQESIRLSSPRNIFSDWVIVRAVGWSDPTYPDIRCGYRLTRAEDIGKSSALTALVGIAGDGSVFRNIRFERSDASFRTGEVILFENWDARTADNGEILFDNIAIPNQVDVPAIVIKDKRENLRFRDLILNYLIPAAFVDSYTTLALDANNSATSSSDVLRWIWLENIDCSTLFSGRRSQIGFGGGIGKTSTGARNNAAALVITPQGTSVITQNATTGVVIIEKPNTASENCATFSMGASPNVLRFYISGTITGEKFVHLNFYNGTTYLLRVRNVPREALEKGLSFAVDNTVANVNVTCLIATRGGRECNMRFDAVSYAY